MWPAYQHAYEPAPERCSSDAAPWYVVPADRKWYRNRAAGTLLPEHPEEIGPRYPEAGFDVEACRARLQQTCDGAGARREGPPRRRYSPIGRSSYILHP
ncbi:hypothetical protein [Streptomyces sp. NPDC097981]|uniref:hypothetical protein n=1 Tax=Streptomyces sp. NPDC097981 TaxID=3155428 RepID=UPI003332D9E1